MDPKALVCVLADLVGKGGSAASVPPTALPEAVARATADWAKRIGLPTDEDRTREDCYLISSPGRGDTYVIDFSGDEPEEFRATVVIAGADIIGESLALAW
jgi:hypothetical protein